MNDGGELARAREAAGRMAWAEAYGTLSAVEETLTGEDLEVLACAAYMLGHVGDFQRAMAHAQRTFAAEGRRARAARSAFWLAFTLLLRGDHAQAGGWIGRCERLVEAEPAECAERGLLLLPKTVREETAGDFAAAERTAARAAKIGSRTGDQDLHSLALHFQGRAVVKAGRVGQGMALLDEAMVAVLAGEVWPPVAGNLYCSMLDACHEIFDLRRAEEWTSALAAWWAAQPDMVTFSGQCLVHRADILHVRGEWLTALDETRRALARLVRAVDSYASGAAWYRQGELLRVAGDLPGAERAYREASQWGHEPQPGLSLLRLAEGKTAVAETTIRRVVAGSTDALRRARLLPAYVEIMLAVGDVPAAREAADELERTAANVDTQALHAMAGHADGAALLAEGDPHGALAALRRAWQQWRELDAPYEAARVRALIGQACRALGDLDSAALEHESAQRVFAELGAAMPAPVRVSAEAERALTQRELQVLRLIAAGKTNRAIATDLVLAPKTVDRHVTNILGKLGVSSRAAATAYAYEHGLIR